MYSNNKQIRDVANIAAQIMSGQQPVTEKLHPNQQKLDVHEPEKDELTADDFKKLRAGKKPADVKKEEVEQVEEGLGDIVRGAVKVVKTVRDNEQAYQAQKQKKAGEVLSALKKEEVEELGEAAKKQSPEEKDKVAKKIGAAMDKAHDAVQKGRAEREAARAIAMAKYGSKMKKEEVEQIREYESKGGVYKHKGTYGTEKSTEAGYTDYDKENELAKKNMKEKPNRKKYGARQNFVRSTRVNESFSGLLGVYKDGGLKALAEALVKEEPTNDQYKAELEDNKAKAEGKKAQPNLTKGYVQAVKQEETEIAVINADKANGVQIETIDEKEMTSGEMEKREKIVKSMKKGLEGFKQRYGDRAKNVMYATATKQAMKD
jgi:hypothetical protein